MKYVNFEWYVMNGDFTRQTVDSFNIFDNWLVCDYTNKLCVKYKKDKMTFDDFCKELRGIIMWQEFARCEYEILVKDMFAPEEKVRKIDCFQQVEPNIRQLAAYVLESYYPKLKIDLNVPSEEKSAKEVRG